RVTVEDALLQIRRADVADGDDFQELRVMLAGQDAAFVAAADQRRPDRLAGQLLVAEVGRRGGDRQRAASDDHALHEVPAGQVRGHFGEVLLAEFLLLGGEVEGHGRASFVQGGVYWFS